jgi:hypothetical protein
MTKLDYFRNIKGDWTEAQDNEMREAIDNQTDYEMKLTMWKLFAFDMSYPRPLVAKWASVITKEAEQ